MSSNSSSAVGQRLRPLDDRVITVQVLITVFLFINIILLTVFFLKEAFYTTMRYVFFATVLMSDCLMLVLTNILLLYDYFRMHMHTGLCCSLFVLSCMYTLVTPFTLTAMSLERYVAICMPLRHAELCSPSSTLTCILIIHGLSFVPCVITILSFFASASLSLYQKNVLCSGKVFIIYAWQGQVLAAINQLYFASMCISIVYCYIQVMKVAKVASGEEKKSIWKGIKTVILHAFQLLLCVIQLWCPFIEEVTLVFGEKVFRNVRYFNYIVFYLTPRCLSPLVYGLRDDSFFLALKRYILLGFRGKTSFH